MHKLINDMNDHQFKNLNFNLNWMIHLKKLRLILKKKLMNQI